MSGQCAIEIGNGGALRDGSTRWPRSLRQIGPSISSIKKVRRAKLFVMMLNRAKRHEFLSFENKLTRETAFILDIIRVPSRYNQATIRYRFKFRTKKILTAYGKIDHVLNLAGTNIPQTIEFTAHAAPNPGQHIVTRDDRSIGKFSAQSGSEFITGVLTTMKYRQFTRPLPNRHPILVEIYQLRARCLKWQQEQSGRYRSPSPRIHLIFPFRKFARCA